MSQVVVGGLMTEYKQTGKGKTLLLLHGWGDSLNGFNQLQADLSASFQVVSLDLPGFGKTQASSEVWGLDDYADFVGQFNDKLGLKPFAVVGHSNGGAIAIRGISKGALKASKLVLIASAGIRGEYKGRLTVIRYITKLGKLLTAPLPRSVKKRLRSKVYRSVGSDMLVAEHLQETFKRVVEDDVRQDAAKLAQSTLMIYGDQDDSTPVRIAEKLKASLKNADLKIVPGADHFVHQNQSEEVTKMVKEFLNND